MASSSPSSHPFLTTSYNIFICYMKVYMWFFFCSFRVATYFGERNSRTFKDFFQDFFKDFQDFFGGEFPDFLQDFKTKLGSIFTCGMWGWKQIYSMWDRTAASEFTPYLSDFDVTLCMGSFEAPKLVFGILGQSGQWLGGSSLGQFTSFLGITQLECVAVPWRST